MIAIQYSFTKTKTKLFKKLKLYKTIYIVSWLNEIKLELNNAKKKLK